MKTYLKNNLRRRAFTLIELIVVLMILVGLAGILIPAVTDMVARTHLSACASNMSECSNALQRYETQFLSYPANLDSLMHTSLTAGNDISSLDGELASVDVTLDVDTAAALSEALGTVAVHNAAADATFELPATFVAPADTNVLQGPSAVQQVSLGLETGAGVAGKYVYLGVGPASAMNGTTMVDAPVHFPENAEGNPQTTYSRFLAIFQITNADGTEALERARFVGTISPHGEPLGAELGEYFEVTNNG